MTIAATAIPVLVDANSLLCRSAYASAMSDLKVGAEITGGLFTSIRSLVSILKTLYTTPALGPVILFYDNGRHPRRAKLFPEYKQNRNTKSRIEEKVSKQVHRQLRLSKNFFRALGCRTVSIRNREADDCIAQVCHTLAARGIQPVVISGDRDLYQLFRESRIYDLNNNDIVTESHFRKRFGVPSNLFVYYKAVVGDKSDNIPGIKGVGDKTAATFVSCLGGRIVECGDPPKAMKKWLFEIEDSQIEMMTVRVKSILDHANHAVKVCRAVSLHAPGFTGTRLARLNRRVSRVRRYDEEAFHALCRRYKFRSLLADVDVAPLFTAINKRRLELC